MLYCLCIVELKTLKENESWKPYLRLLKMLYFYMYTWRQWRKMIVGNYIFVCLKCFICMYTEMKKRKKRESRKPFLRLLRCSNFIKSYLQNLTATKASTYIRVLDYVIDHDFYVFVHIIVPIFTWYISLYGPVALILETKMLNVYIFVYVYVYSNLMGLKML